MTASYYDTPATIYCYLKSDRSVYAQCQIIVEKVVENPITSITLSETNIDLILDEYGEADWELNAFFNPEDTDDDEMWSSVAEYLDMVGVVAARGVGTTRIKCYSKTNPSVCDYCTVTVRPRD